MPAILGSWVAPILMIPGMALLVISTANRYSQLLLYLASHENSEGFAYQLRQIRLALVSLYAGIAAHALAGLAGGLLSAHPQLAQTSMLVLSCTGVLALLLASLALARDAMSDPLRSTGSS